jgi:hypothetical protein
MRTTLNIDDDVLQAAKETAEREDSRVGKVISDWARRGFFASDEKPRKSPRYRNGVPILPYRDGEIITLKHIQDIMDEEDI